jgi:hypothetical protein
MFMFFSLLYLGFSKNRRPKPLKIASESFKFFSFAEIFASQGGTLMLREREGDE